MLTVQRLSTSVFRLPMQGSLRWGKASALHELCHVLVQVELSDGSIGVAEAPPRPTIYGETAQSITTIVELELAPRLIGLAVEASLDSPTLERVLSRLHEVKNNQTARGAVDMALHHALAVHRGISLAEHLGVTAQRVPVSYILGIGDRETVLAEAQRVYEQGVRVLKVKVGREWDDDVARIQALREHFGTRMTLYADANEGLDPEEAPIRLAQLAEMGLRYCEEPLPVEQIQERAALRRRAILPLIADDSVFSLRDLRRELSVDTFDILNVKTARTGYTESRQMLALAWQAGKGAMVGSQASAGLGTARAGLLAGLSGIDHPSELSFFLKLESDIVDRAIIIRDGYVYPAELADVQVDPDLLRTASVK